MTHLWNLQGRYLEVQKFGPKNMTETLSLGCAERNHIGAIFVLLIVLLCRGILCKIAIEPISLIRGFLSTPFIVQVIVVLQQPEHVLSHAPEEPDGVTHVISTWRVPKHLNLDVLLQRLLSLPLSLHRLFL